MSQPHGVFYFANLVAVKRSQRGEYTNCELVLIREGATETDKISVKPDSAVEKAAQAIPIGSEVWVQVIPARRAISKAGNVYVKAPFALGVSVAE